MHTITIHRTLGAATAALALALAPVTPACAQWQFSAGAGMRQAGMTETGKNGQTLVREEGWLAGLELRADHVLREWRMSVAAETYRNDIRYDGRLQNGAPFATDTDTRQTRASLELARRFGRAGLIGAIEWDLWQRRILGHGGVTGMEERTVSWRLLAGAETGLMQSSRASARLKVLLVLAQPEKLRVRFGDQLFDDAALSTKRALGARVALEVQSAGMPRLSFAVDADWLRIGRSDDAPLRSNGNTVGLLAQPEHRRSALGLRVNYRF
jgi:hypothetical protein